MSASCRVSPPPSVKLTPPGMAVGPVDPDTNDCDAAFDFDLFVIGGGSGGIACAKAAANCGSPKKIAVCDFVLPSTQGSTWGLGGTCVNVGCVPKKLMHQAAILGEGIHHCASAFGWGDVKEPEYDDNFNVKHGKVPPIGEEGWARLVGNIQNHIAGLNFGYSSEMMINGIEYINGYARFTGSHTVECTLGVDAESSKKQTFTARRFLLATGCRPSMLNGVPGAMEYCITSDDLFSLRRNPGKTLFIGAGYIALECAGFINGFGNEVKVMMRSIPLRAFDRQMSQLVVESMKRRGVVFIEGSVPISVEKLDDGSLKVKYETTVTNEETQETETNISEEQFDTVCIAVGRNPDFSIMSLHAAGDIALSDKDNKIIVDQYNRTSIPHIYAIGDTVAGSLELMPVAVREGKLLANRLFNGSTVTLNYDNIPTTIFSPLEYACVGLSEEAANDKYGMIEVYHTNFTPLEWTLPMIGSNECYMKVIVNPFDKEKVLGFHILGPNAGEIIQGVALAMQTRSGLYKDDLDRCVGVHPTVAEEMTSLMVSKSSGVDPKKKGC